MATQLVRTNQVRNTTLGVALLELTALYFALRLSPLFDPGMVWAVLLVAVGVWAWRHYGEPTEDDPQEPEIPAYEIQLRYWCKRLKLDMPEIKKHEYTDTGERYWLKVTGDYINDVGQSGVLTPEMFASYWSKFRAIAGDNCRGVFISKPDHRHGGRCTMTVVRAESGKEESPWPVPVMLTDSSIRMCYSEADIAKARAEAERNGYVDPDPAWPAPVAANRAGEG